MKNMATEREQELKEAETAGPAAVKTATVIEKDLLELKIIRTIGTGTFGRVKLVQHAKTRVVMAMKCLRKTQVIAARQQNNIMCVLFGLRVCMCVFVSVVGGLGVWGLKASVSGTSMHATGGVVVLVLVLAVVA